MRGGGSIRARDDIFEFTDVTNHDWTHIAGQTSWRKDNKTQQEQLPPFVHTFIFFQAHFFMLESTPYFLKSATWTDDLTPFLSTTGYCWKAVEMSAQQVRVLSTKRKTFVACTRSYPSAEERLTRWRARPTDMRAQPVSQLGSKTTSYQPHLTGAPLPPFSSTPPRTG